ncbi:MAG: AMP-binding protein [Myxococcota bacterium]
MSAHTRAIDLLFRHVRSRPDAPAFTLGDVTQTFGDLDAAARRYAAWLVERGVAPGDRVACLMGTSLVLPIVLLGNYYAGAIYVPINTRYGRAEIEHIVDDARPEVLVVDADAPQRTLIAELAADSSIRQVLVVGSAEDLGAHEVAFAHADAYEPVAGEPAPSDEDLAMFIYTSGTTGRSKGVEVPYRAVVRGIDALTRRWRFNEADTLVLALPLFHVHGLGIGVHGTLIRGNRTILHERFEPAEVLQAVGDHEGIFMGVPTMYRRLVDTMQEDLERTGVPGYARLASWAKLYTSGSAALSADLFARFEQLTGHRILERYGMSETMLTISNPYEPERRKPGAIGQPIEGVEARVVNDADEPVPAGEAGELQVRGVTLMRGYWERPAKTRKSYASGGWFRTGDAVRVDDEGYYVHVGRRSVDILKSGGYKISAREVEDTLARHPDIDEVAVVGVPDDEWGQLIAAAIVQTQGAKARTAEEWVEECGAFLDGELARFKHPREVVLLEELPRNALGKVQKHRIL